MNQLIILATIEKLIAEIQKEISKHYDIMQNELVKVFQEYYEKYGEKGIIYLKSVIIYKRIESIVSTMDKLVTEQYQLMLKALLQAQGAVLEGSYLMFAYLIELFQKDYGRITKLNSKIKDEILSEGLVTSFKDMINKYKNDLVYKIKNTFTEAARSEENFTQFSKRLKDIVKSTKGYFNERVRDSLTSISDTARDYVFNIVKEPLRGKKIWLATLDTNTRKTHRYLDGQVADNKGYFHLRNLKAKLPKTWTDSSENYGCRCHVIYTFFDKFPEVREGYDYQDDTYQNDLAEKIDELLPNNTYKQSLEKAMEDIKPPKSKIPFISYEQWFMKYGEIN